MVALDPALDLAFEIALRFAQVSQANLGVVQAVQTREVIEERFAQSPRRLRRKRHTRWGLAAHDYSPNRLHQVEGRIENRQIVAIEERFRCDRISGVQFRQYAILARHVVRGPDLAAKGRASQHDFPVTHSHQVRQIGVSARELFDGNRSAVAEVLQQKRPQPGEIEFFACSHRSRLIAKCHHTRNSCIRYRYVSNESPSRCGCALNVLSVKRSPEAKNSLNEPLRDIQVSRSVASADEGRGRRSAAPIAPGEVNTTALAAGGVSRTTCASPRSTRKQNSCQDSMPAAVTSPATHLLITASNSF